MIQYKRVRNLKRPMAEINVVPYIDVMLVLLVIFMITTPLLTRGVDIQLPKAHANAIEKAADEPIIVSVDKKGLYYLNIAQNPREPLAPMILANRIKSEIQLQRAAHRQRAMLVKGDAGVAYGAVVNVMALLQQAGVKDVGLLTDPTTQQNK